MTRNPITFQGYTYKTQTEFESYIRKLLYEKIGSCNSIKNEKSQYYEEIIDLLKRHPTYDEKIKNMSDIKLVTDKLNVRALKLMIINNDGSECDISWKLAITGKHKSSKEELRSALRSSIDDQTYEFKKTSIPMCEICNCVENLHVDHILHFEEIAQNFLNLIEQTGDITIPSKFGDMTDGTHRRCFLEADKHFEATWRRYHNEHSTFRILCRTHNLSRKKFKPET
jgi:hypothetical protein